MTTLEKIIENLKTMPESAEAEVLDYAEYLIFKEGLEDESYRWSEFSLDSAMHGVAEEPSP
ncbi:MAG: DUF2281 domain-containing protein [Deltaproteobacteria bacterium]|nr:DUF2281 domain-containing protein [Deltaproteobacteria bacterium]